MSTLFSREEYVRGTMDRIDREVLDICTKCGECAKACPMTEPAGIGDENPSMLVEGVLGILTGKGGSAEAEKWVDACSSSGSCRAACSYGVDPMFMMQMAKVSVLNSRQGAKEAQAKATRSFQKMAKSVRFLSRLFLKPEVLDRLAPAKTATERTEAPGIVFYTGCNVLRTPHIALICLDILDLLNIDYEVMGGPSHCCGAYQVREGDLGAATGMAMNTIGKMAKAAASEVVSWCPSCQLQFGGNHLPTYADLHGGKPFDFNPFYLFLERHIDVLAPHIKHSVNRKVALDERAFDPRVNAAVKRILGLIPGLEQVELDVKHVGMMRNMISLPHLKKSSREDAFASATAAGIDTFATVYHACHREIVSYSDTVSFEIVNAIELIADSLGISHHDSYKEFQRVTDIDKFIDDRIAIVESHGVSLDELRTVALNEFADHHPVTV
jgi:heterodisulfide reductase subunit D